MAIILCLDTATTVCSVALGKDGLAIHLKETTIPNIHSSHIIPFIEEVLAKAGLSLSQVDAVAVSKGPGSYTGLRIGVSTAKGLCFALDKPMIAISALRSLAHAMASRYRNNDVPHAEDILLCPMIDARRMEVYSAIYDMDNREIRDIRAEVVTGDLYSEFLRAHRMVFFGNGAAKCRDILGEHPNAIIQDDFLSSAAHLVALAENRFVKGQFVDVAYFEPFYLKDFIAGKPRVKGLYE